MREIDVAPRPYLLSVPNISRFPLHRYDMELYNSGHCNDIDIGIVDESAAVNGRELAVA